jgi:hypothetical protein
MWYMHDGGVRHILAVLCDMSSVTPNTTDVKVAEDRPPSLPPSSPDLNPLTFTCADT